MRRRWRRWSRRARNPELVPAGPTKRVAPAWSSSRGHHDGRVVAGADVGEDGAAGRALGDRARREDVVDAPADVALAHVAPRWPPGEQALIVEVERARDVDQVAVEQRLEKLALLRSLPDDAGLA